MQEFIEAADAFTHAVNGLKEAQGFGPAYGPEATDKAKAECVAALKDVQKAAKDIGDYEVPERFQEPTEPVAEIMPDAASTQVQAVAEGQQFEGTETVDKAEDEES